MTQTSEATAPAPVATLPPPATAAMSREGLMATAGAFVIWGLFPIYLYALKSVDAVQITAHRIAWSCVLALALIGARGELQTLWAAVQRREVLTRLATTAFLVSINWLSFVWAVNHERVVEVSLGYYINPLVNVLLGTLILKERLNRLQWAAVAVATAGVVYLTIAVGHLPWIALTLALSFGLYGFIRKTASIEALPGLAIEMTLLTPLAVGFLVWCELTGTGALGHSSVGLNALLILSGVVTATPLFLFAYGARRIPYSTVGILQYIGPSLQLVCGVLIFGEPFEGARVVGFSFIWLALLLYAGDGLWRGRSMRSHR